MRKLKYPQPWMLAKEVDYLDEFIERKKPNRILEWGAGGSTVYFLDEHTCIEKWLSIEHDPHWFNRVKKQTRAEVRLCKGDDYLDIEGKYDMILVDGIKRNKCLQKSVELLAENGVCFLHDADRDKYRPYPEAFRAEKVIDGRGNTDGLIKFNNAKTG